MVPYPKELWDRVRDMVIAGMAYKEIEKQTGISHKVISVKAANSKWTVTKAERKAEAQLESLRPKLHAHLQNITKHISKINKRSMAANSIRPIWMRDLRPSLELTGESK